MGRLLASGRLRWVCVVLLASAAGGCSIRKLAINGLADTLSASGDVFASDDDPELIRDATPFALKTIESLLASAPEHQGLLLQACQGFTQYGFGFVELDAEAVEPEDFAAARALRERALKLYLRAHGYCMRALELRHPGIGAGLTRDPTSALGATRPEEVPLLYWSGVSWGAAVTLGKERPDLLADWPAVEALLRRALELQPSWNQGAIHEALISIDCLPATMGGSLERAREHYRAAVELSGGRRVSPHVTMALGLVGTQNRAEFERLLELALDVDPEAEPSARLQNLLLRERARRLLARVDDLFLD